MSTEFSFFEKSKSNFVILHNIGVVFLSFQSIRFGFFSQFKAETENIYFRHNVQTFPCPIDIFLLWCIIEYIKYI